MKIGLITTLRVNLGDDLVRAGIVQVLQDVLARHELEFVPINKHQPLSAYPKWHPIQLSEVAKLLPRGNAKVPDLLESIFWKLGFDCFKDCELIVQCGAPVVWPECHRAEWARPLWHHIVGSVSDRIPVLNLAAGSCYAWENPPAAVTSPEEAAYLRSILGYCILTTSRDRLARDLFKSLGTETPLLPCSALLSASREMLPCSDAGFVIVNYMRGAGHYDRGQHVDADRWQATMRSALERLKKRHNIKFLCHNESEYKLAAEIDPTLARLWPKSCEEFFAEVRGAKAALCNRLHASVGLASLGIPSVSVGTDTRLLMIETLGLPFHYVKEADAAEMEAEVEGLISSSQERERLLDEKEKTWRDYRQAVSIALDSFSAVHPSRKRQNMATSVPVPRRIKQSDASIAAAHSILVIRPDAIGDLVLMSPFLRELRHSNATCRITLLVDPQFSNLVELCPYVNEVLEFDGSSPGALTRLCIFGRAHFFAKRVLRRRNFDMALCPRWDVDYYYSALVCYVSKAKRRVAFSQNVSPLKRQLNRHHDRMFTHTLNDSAPRHEVDRNLEFLKKVGGTVTSDALELWLSEEDRTVARDALVSKGLGRNELLVALAPGAGHRKRLWPLDRFVQLGRQLVHEFGVKILVVGGERDKERAWRLAEALGCAGFTFADLTIRQTAALLELAELAISNDSGPMHLAAAAGTPTVEISCHPANGDPLHANSPMRFRPWIKEHAVIQPKQAREPCELACEWQDAHCILGISVTAVLDSARSILLRNVGGTHKAVGAQVGRP